MDIDYYFDENERLIKSTDLLLEIINNFDLYGTSYTRYPYQISELKIIYNKLRSVHHGSVEVGDRFIRLHHSIWSNNDFPKGEEYRIGAITNFTLNDLNLYTGDILKTRDGEEGMLVIHSNNDSGGLDRKKYLRLVMDNRIIDVDYEKIKGELKVKGLDQLHLRKPYHMLAGDEKVAFCKDNVNHTFTLSISFYKEHPDVEANRRFDTETTDEIIGQLFPEY